MACSHRLRTIPACVNPLRGKCGELCLLQYTGGSAHSGGVLEDPIRGDAVSVPFPRHAALKWRTHHIVVNTKQTVRQAQLCRHSAARLPCAQRDHHSSRFTQGRQIRRRFRSRFGAVVQIALSTCVESDARVYTSDTEFVRAYWAVELALLLRHKTGILDCIALDWRIPSLRGFA